MVAAAWLSRCYRAPIMMILLPKTMTSYEVMMSSSLECCATNDTVHDPAYNDHLRCSCLLTFGFFLSVFELTYLESLHRQLYSGSFQFFFRVSFKYHL